MNLFFHISWGVSILISFAFFLLNQKILKMNWILLGKIPKGKAIIRMEDGTSHAVIYWDNKKSCCSVIPVLMPESLSKFEEERARTFYACPVKTTIITHKEKQHGFYNR